MSMNITPSRPELAGIERFSPAIAGFLFLLPFLAAGAAGTFFGLAWGGALFVLVIWSDVLLRLAAVNFRGRRKKDKVMAPLVEKTFSSHAPDSALGWVPAPSLSTTNSFSIPRKKLRLDYTVTTDDMGRRITASGDMVDTTKNTSTISFYGCSNTFGWGLDDDTTYPWLLQADHPDIRIHNYGVAGYSLYQMLLRMEQTIEQDKPKIVILGFSPGLEARSVSDHQYLRILSEQGGTPPSCLSAERKGGKRKLKRFPPEAYKHLPFSDSSPLIKLIERALNRFKYAGRAKNDGHRKTTEHLLLAMDNLCRKNDIVFHVQYLVANTGYRRFLKQAGINWAPGPVDLDLCDEVGTYTYRLSPFDGHPNIAANKAYAEALKPIIQQLLDTGSYAPEPGALGTTSRDKATEAEIYPIF